MNMKHSQKSASCVVLHWQGPIPDTIANLVIGSVDGGVKGLGRFKRYGLC